MGMVEVSRSPLAGALADLRMNWFRVPAFLGGRLHGDHVATEPEAWIDLLGRWSLGEDVSACAFADATCWGKGRVLKFMPKAAEWAIANGGTLPRRWAADRNADQDRTVMRTGPTSDEPDESTPTGPLSDRNADQDRTVSHARVPPAERDEIKTEQIQILSATADVVPSAPEKRKAVRKAKTATDPHPCHQRVIDAWKRVWGKCRVGDPPYVWADRDVMILVKCVRDPYVSRDPAKADEDMQRVGAAMTRYLSQEVDGRFVKGLSIQGFAGNVAQWFTAVDATLSVRRAPAEHRSISDILGESESPPPLTPNRDAIDVAYRVIT
jgi:hypothetical protein